MRIEPRSALSLILFSALALASSACGSSRAVAPVNEIVGDYTLVAVNGSAVPADVEHDGVTMRVMSGSMSFRSDGTCRSTMRFIAPTGQEAVNTVAADYTVSGETVTMRWQGAGTTTGVLQGNAFTMDNVGMILRYLRDGG